MHERSPESLEFEPRRDNAILEGGGGETLSANLEIFELGTHPVLAYAFTMKRIEKENNQDRGLLEKTKDEYDCDFVPQADDQSIVLYQV